VKEFDVLTAQMLSINLLRSFESDEESEKEKKMRKFLRKINQVFL